MKISKPRYYIDLRTGCHVWNGRRDGNGNPLIGVKGRRLSPRRWLFEQHHGIKVPESQKVISTCGNPDCVNPAHCRVLTDQERDRGNLKARLHSISAILNQRVSKHLLVETAKSLWKAVQEYHEQYGLDTDLLERIIGLLHRIKARAPTETMERTLGQQMHQLITIREAKRKDADKPVRKAG